MSDQQLLDKVIRLQIQYARERDPQERKRIDKKLWEVQKQLLKKG